MEQSAPASDTTISAAWSLDIQLPNAFSMLTVQDPSIPPPGSCYINKCPNEILIQMAENLDYKSLCALSCVSERFAEAAQDVLYRFVDLCPGTNHDDEHMFGAIDCLFKSRLALFHWTINRKPHLATKVRELWFLPRRESVEYQLEYPGAFATSTGIASGDRLTFILERRLACDLLVRLTELRSLAIAALNDKYEGRIIALENLPDHPIQLTDLPCFSKLISIHITCGYLNWTIVTLPTVRTICVDNFARVDRPTGDSKAWNITSFILNMDSNISQFHKNFIVAGAAQLLIFLPNVRSLTLGSRLPDMDHHEKVAVFNRFRLFSLGNVRKLLVNGPSIEELKFTYEENALFYGCGMVQLDVRQFNQLRRIESAERGLLGTSYHASGPVDILPPHIRTLVITHPTSLK